MRKAFQFKSHLILSLIVFVCGCRTVIRTHPDPFEESFFEKTRLIMTDDEIKAYRSLDGEEPKQAFIEKFWKIRDPYPETEENENKMEFESRILYANEWFDRYRRRRRDYDAKSARGWQTAKGRIYVIFGPPASVNYGDGRGPMKKFPPEDAINESWYYPFYELTISFEREKIESKMESIPARGSGENEQEVSGSYVSSVVGSGGWRMIPEFKIIDAIEDAKLRWISPQYRSDVKDGLRFNVKYVRDRIRINIPSDKVIYIDEDGTLKVYLQIDIAVYRGDEKVIDLNENKVLSFSEKEVLELDEIIIEVPFFPTDEGEYGFDVTVTDLKSEVLSKFRRFVKHLF
jgi:GWxTD domain-containing protein